MPKPNLGLTVSSFSKRMATQNEVESTSPRLVYIVVPDHMSTQHNVESTQRRAGSISWSQTRYLPFNRMVTQHWAESSLWSWTRWSHSPKRRALDAAQKNQHSLSAREAFSSIPSLSQKYMNFDVVRGLVKISAICSSVRMYCNFRAPRCTWSLMK